MLIDVLGEQIIEFKKMSSQNLGRLKGKGASHHAPPPKYATVESAALCGSNNIRTAVDIPAGSDKLAV